MEDHAFWELSANQHTLHLITQMEFLVNSCILLWRKQNRLKILIVNHWKLLGNFLILNMFRPSLTKDKIVNNDDYEYFHAEKLGKDGAPCDHVFHECKISILDQFSGIYTPIMDFFKKFWLKIKKMNIKTWKKWYSCKISSFNWLLLYFFLYFY